MAKGNGAVGWALYLPEDWRTDEQRRRKAKIPDEVVYKTKPQLGVELSSAPPAGMFRRRRRSVITPMGRTPGYAIVSIRHGASTCCR